MMKYLYILICAFFLTSCVSSEFAVRETESYPMGEGRYLIYVRGNIFADAEMLKTAFYKKANEVCPSGFNIEKMENKAVKHGEHTKPVLEGVIACK